MFNCRFGMIVVSKIRNRWCVSSLLAAMVWLLASPLSAQTNRFTIETSRYRAEFVGAHLISFKNKLIRGAEMVDAPPADAYHFTLAQFATRSNKFTGTPPGNVESLIKDGTTTWVTYRTRNPDLTYGYACRLTQ